MPSATRRRARRTPPPVEQGPLKVHTLWALDATAPVIPCQRTRGYPACAREAMVCCVREHQVTSSRREVTYNYWCLPCLAWVLGRVHPRRMHQARCDCCGGTGYVSV